MAIANVCNVPIALVSLVESERLWFKSAYGLQISETNRDVAFCARTIENPDELMIIEDAQKDERFADNPLVTGFPYIRFYAGMSFKDPEGHPVGTLCVIDHSPRKLEDFQRETLAALAATIGSLLEERCLLRATAIDRDHIESLLHEQLERTQGDNQQLVAILDGILSRVAIPAAVVDRAGTIRAANERWQKLDSEIPQTLGLVASDTESLAPSVENAFAALARGDTGEIVLPVLCDQPGYTVKVSRAAPGAHTFLLEVGEESN